MRRKREMLRQKWLSRKQMQYPYGMEKLIAIFEEINPAMPPRGNSRVVEEGQGVDSVQERLH